MYRETMRTVTAGFSLVTMQDRNKWSKIFGELKEKRKKPIKYIFIPSENIFKKKGEIKKKVRVKEKDIQKLQAAEQKAILLEVLKEATQAERNVLNGNLDLHKGKKKKHQKW